MRKRAAAVVLVGALVCSTCGGSSDADTVLVMAAASLTEAFREIEVAFEAQNPDIDVLLNLAGSGSLREQILQGAPADVFASANDATMRAVAEAGEAESPMAFATNELRIAVPTGNPGGVVGIADMADSDLLIGLCAETVPCGDFARQALEQAGVTASVDTNEGDVRALLAKIEAGELDAGIVYATDVAARADVDAILLPADIDVAISYPIARLTEAPNPDGARAFVDFVLSPAGQAILAANGFGAP